MFFPLDYNRIQIRAVAGHQIIVVYNSKLHAIQFAECPIDKALCLGNKATTIESSRGHVHEVSLQIDFQIKLRDIN